MQIVVEEQNKYIQSHFISFNYAINRNFPLKRSTYSMIFLRRKFELLFFSLGGF